MCLIFLLSVHIHSPIPLLRHCIIYAYVHTCAQLHLPSAHWPVHMHVYAFKHGNIYTRQTVFFLGKTDKLCQGVLTQVPQCSEIELAKRSYLYIGRVLFSYNARVLNQLNWSRGIFGPVVSGRFCGGPLPFSLPFSLWL